MTRLDALRALYDGIKAGTLPDEVVCPTAFADDFHNGYRCVEAYHGSVDAALAFIAATLPDAEVDRIRQSKSLKLWRATLGLRSDLHTGDHAQLSVALLLAGLAALIQEEEAK